MSKTEISAKHTPGPKAPPGYHFDAFADARMGRSLFQMEPEDWLVPDKSGCQYCDGYCHGGCREGGY